MLSVTITGDGPPTIAAATAGDHVDLTVTGHVGDLSVAAAGLRVGSASLKVGVSVDAAGTPGLTAAVTLPEAAFTASTGFLSVLLGDTLQLPAPLDIVTRPGQGLLLNGNTELRAPLPTPGALGPLDIRRLDVTLAVAHWCACARGLMCWWVCPGPIFSRT